MMLGYLFEMSYTTIVLLVAVGSGLATLIHWSLSRSLHVERDALALEIMQIELDEQLAREGGVDAQFRLGRLFESGRDGKFR